jgi:hypothetical protein
MKGEMKNKISMALKDPILQQGFEIICKNLAKLEAYNKKLLQSDIDKQNKIVLLSHKVNDLQKENTELGNDMKTTVSLLKRSVEISKSLSKAEDLLKQWLKLYNTNTVKGIIADTEQFLKEE